MRSLGAEEVQGAMCRLHPYWQGKSPIDRVDANSQDDHPGGRNETPIGS